jgi:hypothetical protein
MITGTAPSIRPPVWDNYVLEGKYKILAVYLDTETDEFVIEYEIVE